MSTFTLTQIDDDGGAAVTHVLHRINAGAAVATPIAVLPQTVDIAAQAGDEVQIALRNAIGDGPWSAALTFQAPIDIIPIPLSLTSGVVSISFNLDTIQPPSADPTTWSHALLAPGTGQALVDPTFTLSGIGTDIFSGQYIARRTIDGGGLQNLAFAVTVVQPSLTVTSDIPTLTVGDDDPDSMDYILVATTDPPGGPWDGVPVNLNRGLMDAAIAAGNAAFIGSGLIGFTTDAGSVGAVDVDDVVTVTRPPLSVPSTVPITQEWQIDGVGLGNGTVPFTRTALQSGTALRMAWTGGATTVFSNELPLAAVQPAGMGLVGSPTTIKSTTNTALPTFQIPTPGAISGNRFTIVYSGPGAFGAVTGVGGAPFNFEVPTVTVNGAPATVRFNGGNGVGQRVWMFDFIFPAAANSVEVQIGLAAASADHTVTGFVMRNAQFQTASLATAATALSVQTEFALANPAEATNFLVGVAHFLAPQTTRSWTVSASGPMTQIPLSSPNAHSHVATIGGLSTGVARTFTATGDVSGSLLGAVLRFVPAA